MPRAPKRKKLCDNRGLHVRWYICRNCMRFSARMPFLFLVGHYYGTLTCEQSATHINLNSAAGHRNSLLLNRAKNARNLLYLMSLTGFSRAFLSLSGMPVLSSR